MKAVIFLSLFSLSLTAKSYFSLISDDDQRGQHCEITEIKPEPNITGLAILCKNKIMGPNGSLDQISVIWPPQKSDETNAKITKSLHREMNGGIYLEANDKWLIGKLIKNPLAPYAHTAIFHAYKVISSPGKVDVEINDVQNFAKY